MSLGVVPTKIVLNQMIVNFALIETIEICDVSQKLNNLLMNAIPKLIKINANFIKI